MSEQKKWHLGEKVDYLGVTYTVVGHNDDGTHHLENTDGETVWRANPDHMEEPNE